MFVKKVPTQTKLSQMLQILLKSTKKKSCHIHCAHSWGRGWGARYRGEVMKIFFPATLIPNSFNGKIVPLNHSYGWDYNVFIKSGFHQRRSRSRSRSRKVAYVLVNTKNCSRKRSHKRYGIGVRRIRTFPFSSDSTYDFVAHVPFMI